MTRVVIELARPEDDDAMRRIARENPMEGPITLAFLREPDYFHGALVQGDFVQVNVARDAESGLAVGMGTRAVKRGFLNGEPAWIGYLSDLRLGDAYRGGTVIARAYKYLRGIHDDHRTRIYNTVIMEGNQTALGTIATGRAGLPRYHDMGALVTTAIIPIRPRPPVAGRFDVVRGSRELLPGIVQCLNAMGARRQFGGRYAEEDFLVPATRFRGLALQDFHVAVEGGRVLATVARWDQSPFKQARVVAYRGTFRVAVRAYNLVMPLLGAAPYPPPGEDLSSFHAALLSCVSDEDTGPAAAVLRALYNDAVGGRTQYFLVGLHERDPLGEILEPYWGSTLRARYFGVTFPEDEEVFRGLDSRVPHVEISML